MESLHHDDRGFIFKIEYYKDDNHHYPDASQRALNYTFVIPDEKEGHRKHYITEIKHLSTSGQLIEKESVLRGVTAEPITL